MYRLIIFLFPLIISCSFSSPTQFSVPEKPWDESLGNHRAILKVEQETDAVYLDLLWRRHDRWPERKKFIIIQSETGDTIQNIHRVDVNNERCRLVFGPVKKGIYNFYYMPYEIQKNYGFYNKGYLKKEDEPDKQWQKNILDQIESLPKAKVLDIQSRTDFDRFFPMEIIPLKSEKNEFLSNINSDFIVFPESRNNPIRMKDEIPLKWLKKGLTNSFTAAVFQNEYFAFQLGVFAHSKDVKNIQVEYSDLCNDQETIPAGVFTCFNLEGVNPYGEAFKKQIDIDSGFVQPLWIGVDIPNEINPGKYQASIKIKGDNTAEQEIKIKLKINNEKLADRGDSEPWRHSRLRWLNSTLGIDDEPTSNYNPIKFLGNQTYNFSGKILTMAATGMPASIKIYGTEILKRPIEFVVEFADKKKLAMKTENIKLLNNSDGVMTGSWENNSPKISMKGVGTVEADGYMNFKIRIKANANIALNDVRLEIPFKNEVAKTMMGMGLPGTATPAKHQAKWEGPHDSFWVGNTKGGLWCELRGSNYHGPLLNLYRPEFPESWFNNNKGGFQIQNKEGAKIAKVLSGKRTLQAGEEIEFEWSFLMTPVKKLDTKSQFVNRYYHNGGAPTPPQKALDSGVKIVNLHHANEFNPHINYPFVAVNKMKQFVNSMHAKGQKVKIYYTVRELSNYTAEIWALRSLGTEILGYGRGYGYPWLQEHFINGYRPQWYQWFPDKSADASIVNAPGDSRWLNYYIEGLKWLVQNVDIDGLYLDDVSFDRRTVKRIRKVLDNQKPGCLIDLHSNTGFSKGPATQYMEYFPFIDKIWFGESFKYNEMNPENWLVEVSGIPFGLMGDMLQGGGNRWLGMLFGMTTRLPWSSDKIKADPRPVWKIWDEFEIYKAKMIGFWEDETVVETSHPDVKVTAYLRAEKTLISVGNFSDKRQNISLKFDWEKLGINPENVTLKCPEIKDFQAQTEFGIGDKIPVDAKKGWLIFIEKN